MTQLGVLVNLNLATREILEGKAVSEEDIEAWSRLSLPIPTILRWHKAGFTPVTTVKWEREGFNTHSATYWKDAEILLKWAAPMRRLGQKTEEVLEWMKLSPHLKEISQAVKAKLPLTTAK
ncbi:hypothetical protein DSO57_1002351 [Entomophthora muscae]|uniref:Uncharacterized protein n=1 Tax=Entomophthora muscae TaxID=34485 RepID=A0ACC2UUM7_9FUNG|nr:hypothetical protein DSO57_1002351 [Entomophthora muscae]